MKQDGSRGRPRSAAGIRKPRVATSAAASAISSLLLAGCGVLGTVRLHKINSRHHDAREPPIRPVANLLAIDSPSAPRAPRRECPCGGAALQPASIPDRSLWLQNLLLSQSFLALAAASPFPQRRLLGLDLLVGSEAADNGPVSIACARLRHSFF